MEKLRVARVSIAPMDFHWGLIGDFAYLLLERLALQLPMWRASGLCGRNAAGIMLFTHGHEPSRPARRGS